ncbi:MAG: transposase, partial [Bacteroidales bacterium]
PDKILEKRREIALPIINQIKSWIEENYPKVLPGSRIGKAMSYNYTLMDRLIPYVHNSSLLIDNNRAENAIRPIALNRKNTLFCGNHNAANNTAIIFTIIGCCKEHKINVREYLNDILSQLPYHSNSSKDLKNLLPWEWIKSHQESILKESE